jgi:hypothetical protein
MSVITGKIVEDRIIPARGALEPRAHRRPDASHC